MLPFRLPLTPSPTFPPSRACSAGGFGFRRGPANQLSAAVAPCRRLRERVEGYEFASPGGLAVSFDAPPEERAQSRVSSLADVRRQYCRLRVVRQFGSDPPRFRLIEDFPI